MGIKGQEQLFRLNRYNLIIISNKVRSLIRKELKLRPEGGEKVSRPLAGTKENFPKGKVLKD